MTLRTFTRTFAGGRLASGMARLNARHPWSHNDHFHRWILGQLPERRRTALDVGCGQGALLAALAPRFDAVIGADTDARMRADAAERCADLAHVRVDDRDWTDVDGPLDLVTMVAVLHHLDVDAALRHVRDVLAPGGRLLVVGLAPPASPRDHVWDAASIVTNPLIGLAKHPRVDRSGPRPAPYPVRDPTMTYDELADRVAAVLPDATMRHRLGFRHTIVWTSPEVA